MYIIICEMITSPGSVHETGCSGLVHRGDPEGWDGEGVGRGVQDGEHMAMSDSVWHLLLPNRIKKNFFSPGACEEGEGLGNAFVCL